MATSYNFGPASLDSIQGDLERISAQAVADGRTYSLHISKAGAGEFTALITVHDRPDAAEGGAE